MRHISQRALALGAFGGLVLAFAFAGAANAITDTSFRYSAPKTGYLTITAAAFTPGNVASAYINNGAVLTPSTTNLTCWYAPVNLPHGATMSQLALWYISESPDLVIIELTRRTLADGAEGSIVGDAAPASGGLYRRASYPITGAMQTVDNARYGYYVRLCLQYDGTGTTPQYHGSRITYTYTSAGD
jgi:hypothetical protein